MLYIKNSVLRFKNLYSISFIWYNKEMILWRLDSEYQVFYHLQEATIQSSFYIALLRVLGLGVGHSPIWAI